MSDRNYLAHRMNVLRTLAGSPHEAYTAVTEINPNDPRLYKPNVGYVGHEHNSYSGHRVYEIITDTGGERNLCSGMKLQTVIGFVDGCIVGMEGRVCRYGTVS